MARGDNIATSVPIVGAVETGGTSDVLTILTALVAIAESKVVPSEINMNATLDFNSQAGENVKYFEFVTQGSAPTLNETLYTKNVTRDELFYKDSSGSEVQITSNGSLNVSATGAITGAGYGSGGVAVNWNSAGTNYQFKSGSGADDYAAVTCDGLQLRDGSAHAVTLDSPALGANYTITMPSAVPAGTYAVAMDTSGNLTNNSTFTVPSGSTITVAGGGKIDFATVNDLVYADHWHFLSAYAAAFTGTWTLTSSGIWNNADTSSVRYLRIPLKVSYGQRIKSIRAYCLQYPGSATLTMKLRYLDSSSTLNDVSGWSATQTAAGAWSVTGTAEAVPGTTPTREYFIEISLTPDASGYQFGLFSAQFDSI